jgi:hypothetical protein
MNVEQNKSLEYNILNGTNVCLCRFFMNAVFYDYKKI